MYSKDAYQTQHLGDEVREKWERKVTRDIRCRLEIKCRNLDKTWYDLPDAKYLYDYFS
jgi:hypothetical protein